MKRTAINAQAMTEYVLVAALLSVAIMGALAGVDGNTGLVAWIGAFYSKLVEGVCLPFP